MGGIEQTKESWELKSGSWLAFMGSITMDLTKAELSQDEINMSLTAFMGGIEILVPTDMVVICEGNSFLGGIELLGKSNGGIFANLQAKQGQPGEGRKVLHLECFSFMGGVEIKVAP
jgi:predicted membrane protein